MFPDQQVVHVWPWVGGLEGWRNKEHSWNSSFGCCLGQKPDNFLILTSEPRRMHSDIGKVPQIQPSE